jgi:hypothetical protein
MWMMRHCSMMHQRLQRNDRNFCWLWIHVLVQRQRRMLTKVNTAYKNIYASSNAVVKFCEKFSHVQPTHNIKQSRQAMYIT